MIIQKKDNHMEQKRLDLEQFTTKIELLRKQIASVVVGQEQVADLLLAAVLADGHILLEGVPGVAKTLLARLLARLIDCRFSRIQFTPDLMPSDVLGTNVFSPKDGEFHFHPGPVFADLVLADEINRSPAKTQAALFEAMQERQVTVDGVTWPMGELYTVIATQNPVEQEGTYRLPEAQLDRFLMKITVGYPVLEAEVRILRQYESRTPSLLLNEIEPVLTRSELLQMRALLSRVVVDSSLYYYLVHIIRHTRESKWVYLGASPRASIALLQVSKAFALLQGRDFVTPDDIKTVAPYVLQHRLLLTAEAEMEGYTPLKVITHLTDQVEVPK